MGLVEGGPRGSQRGRREEVWLVEIRRAEECCRGRRDVGVEHEPVWVSVRRGRGSLKMSQVYTQQPRRRGRGLWEPVLNPLLELWK